MQMGPKGGVEAGTAQRWHATHGCSKGDETWALTFPHTSFKAQSDNSHFKNQISMENSILPHQLLKIY